MAADVAPLIHIEILGLRDLRGRFAALGDAELLALQLEEAAVVGKTLEEIYQRHAPKARKASSSHREAGPFWSTIHARAKATGTGFEIDVETSDPTLRRWLADGTGVYAGNGRIYPKRAKALGPITGWVHASGPAYFASIAGMPPNPWEDMASHEAAPFAEVMGNRIGNRVTAILAGGV